MAEMAAALQRPETGTPPRAPGSARRTSHMDMLLFDDGALTLAGAARDLRTGRDGTGRVLAAAAAEATVAANREMGSLVTDPPVDVVPLLGRIVGRGFREAVDAAVPEHRVARSPLYLLLDELPVAALISGYARMYEGRLPVGAPAGARAGQSGSGLQHDICAGWRSDGVMMTAVASQGGVPTTIGPTAPRLEPANDDLAWHPFPELGPGSMRRRRLVDVTLGDPIAVFAMFRDTHVAHRDGFERVLHEYSVELEVDPSTLTILRSEATPRALPWPECPAAAASARRLEGMHVDDVRAAVRNEFRGTSTCTHLNDLLRSLGDVSVLVGLAG